MRDKYSKFCKSSIAVLSVASWSMVLGCVGLPDPDPPPGTDEDVTVTTAALEVAQAYGGTFIANTFTPGIQNFMNVSSCGNGDSVLLWQDDARGNGLFTRRYTAGGIPLQRDEQFVDPTGVPVGGIGCFGIARDAPDGSGSGVYVEIFDRDGNVIIPEFRVNEVTAGDQSGARVAVNARGQFVVVWQEGIRAIYAKLFQPNGTAVAPAQVVASSGPDVVDPHVAINSRGEFIVAWDSFTTFLDVDVYVRRYSSTGFAAASASRANTTTTGWQLVPTPAISPAGDFLIVWASTPTTGSGPGENWQWVGRRFSASSNALTNEIPISTGPSLLTFNPSVAIAANGNFMVVWDDFSQPSALGRILARAYRSNGSAFTDPFVVSTASPLGNERPQVAMDVDGNATIAWSQYDPATSDADVAVRRYLPGGISVQTIADGSTITGLSGAAGSWQYFKVTVPPGHNIVDVFISGSVGDADLYVRYGAVPSATGWDGRPFIDGSNEGVEMVNFPSGDWYIGINGFTAYASLSLQVSSR